MLTFSRRARQAVIVLLGLALLAPVARAHDIPNQIILYGFVKPQGERLHFLARVPLVMFLNLNLPKRGPGFLALEYLGDGLDRAQTAIANELLLYEDGQRLRHDAAKARVSLPSSKAFENFDSALRYINGPPLAAETNVFWNQGYIDVHLQYPIRSPQGNFALEPRLAPGLQNSLKLLVRFLPPNATERAYELHYGTGLVALDPRWQQAAWTFIKLGYGHIFDGIDHLLFLLCLVAPFRLRHLWSLLAAITAFTLTHSLTLLAAATGSAPQAVWFAPLIELLIAGSIVYMAIDNVVTERPRYRWLSAGVFGLIHGFGFAYALDQELQFAGAHLTLSLVSFNLGIELGQILFLLAVLPLLGWLLRGARAERYGLIILSLLVGHTAWHWLLERAEAFSSVAPPAIDSGTALAWLVAAGSVIIIVAKTIWRPLFQQPGAVRSEN